MSKVTVYELEINRRGRVSLKPASAGSYRDESGSWMSKQMYCSFETTKEPVAEQIEDALNWVREKNPDCAVQMFGGGGSLPGALFFIIASPK